MSHKNLTRRPSQTRERFRFADPWAFRRPARPERIADINGRELPHVTHRHNGRLLHTISSPHAFGTAVQHKPVHSMLPYLRRLVAAEIARYRMSGHFSEADLRIIIALWQDGLTLRALARREGTSAQAIEDRIVRLQYRATRFFRWWRLKNRARARK